MICAAPGCTEPSRANRLCGKHYYRMRRTGQFGLKIKATTYNTDHGYRRVRVDSNHPLIDTSGTVYEHRAVLFDALGYGPHLCRWCDRPVNWRTGLEVDHVDADKKNNHPDNLVPSCHGCNTRRAHGLAS